MPETATAMDSTTPSDGSEPELLYRVSDGVATLSINRPERRNALSWGWSPRSPGLRRPDRPFVNSALTVFREKC